MKELATYVDLLLQLAEDSANVLSEATTALAQDFGRKESLAFVNGSIALEPSGFMEDANIATTANGSKTALSPDALIALNVFPARHLSRDRHMGDERQDPRHDPHP
nr:phage major capsid protein [Sinirhodobacter populi]